MQEEIIDSVLGGHDTLSLLPTGGGKSLCYQLPALMLEGICLVVSPLIALMKDQVQQLNNRHLKAACIVSGMAKEEVVGVLSNALAGSIKFLYVSPERLKQRLFIEHFRHMKVGMIAVDEAHCVSQWGYDFRPPYLEIAAIRAYHPSAPLIALTATATPAVADDIVARLQMHNCHRFQSSFIRPNLAYGVYSEGDKNQRLKHVVMHNDGSGIVYVRSRKGTQSIALFLESIGVSATFYHAGLDARERDRRQQRWMEGGCRVMVATNAFGMGIDKPDVRFVVHIGMPDSLEAYFQEAGRAGRDGKPSSAILLVDSSDVTQLEHNFQSDYPSLKQLRNAYRALCNYYKLPIGSGADTSHDFNLEAICSSYNFDMRGFYAACGFLEREGLIALPDLDEMGSTLYVTAPRAEIYRLQCESQPMGELLDAVFRMYPGVMTEPVLIDEKKLASRTYHTVPEVVALLVRMKDLKVLEYRPCPTKPQIIFLSPRIDERDICPSEATFGLVKESARHRMEAMIAYAVDKSTCRSRKLVAYFGEHTEADCGICDVCQNRAASPTDAEQEIRKLLSKGAMSVHELSATLELRGVADATGCMRRMLDCGDLVLDKNMRLSLR